MARATRQTLCIALLGIAGLSTASLVRPSEVTATPPASPEAAQPATSTTPADAGIAVQAPADSTNATIVFITTPPATAMVTWGRKRLGKITPGKPLVVVRPRDSGPLDVMVRAAGYLAVQTRAHTFSDSRVVVKLTPPENISELLGYRAPLDAGLDGGVLTPEQAAALNAMGASDAGVMPSAPTFQVVPATPPAPQGPWLVP